MNNIDTKVLLQQLQTRLGEQEFNKVALTTQLQAVTKELSEYKKKYGELPVGNGGDSPSPVPTKD